MEAIAGIWKEKGKVALLSSLLLVVSLFLPNLSTQSAIIVHAEEGNIVLGYYASWAPPENLDPNKVTHMNYSFADVCWEGEHGNPNNEEIEEGEPKTWPCEDLNGDIQDDIANGTIVLYDSETDLEELDKLAKMKEENPDLKTLVSVGGWTLSNNLSLIANDEDAREAFAQSAVEFVKEFDMDGLDLDWEYPNQEGHPGNHLGPEDTKNHTKLLQAVRDAFDKETAETGKEYLVTIAGAQTWTYADNNELAKIAEIVDYLAIMTYDTNGTWSGTTGHNAPLYDDPLEEEIRGWLSGSASMGANVYQSSGVPTNKILIGLPFYGQAWGGCNEDADGAFNKSTGAYQECGAAWEAEPSVESTDYNYIKSIVNKDGYDYYFDNLAKVPYLYNEDKGEFISYDNVESLGYKVNFIKDEGLAGAMIWDLATDDADYNLLKTVSHGLGISSEQPDPDPEQPGEVDVQKLESLIETAEAITIDDGPYTEESYQALKDAIDVANDAVGTIHSEDALIDEINALQAAIDALKEADNGADIDVTDLEVLIATAEGISNDGGKYTDDSYQALRDAIDTANESLDTIQSEEDLESELAALQTAIGALEEVDGGQSIDVTELKSLIEQAEGITNDDEKYTDDSYQVLLDAIDTAYEAVETIDSEEDLNSAIVALQTAIDTLEEVGKNQSIDVTELKLLIEKAESITNDDGEYTDSSYQALLEAIDTAHEAVETIDSEEDLNSAIAALQTAIDNLDIVTDEKDTEKSDDEGEKLPQTASSMHNIMLTGLILLALGTIFILMNRRKAIKKND